MSFNTRSTNLFIITLFIILLIPSVLLSQITLTIGDASGRLGEKFVPLDITFSNASDTIGGYNIWLQLDRPDLVRFQQGIVQLNDTTFWTCNQFSGTDCIDSTRVLSIHSWDFFHVDSSWVNQYLYEKSNYIMPTWFTATNSISGMGTDLNIVSLALPSTLPVYINPPQNDELLIRLYLEVVDSADLYSPPEDSVVNILLQTTFKDHFSFGTPEGKSLAYIPVEIIDTSCLVCDQWEGDVCFDWYEIIPIIGVPIDTSLCDSLDIFFDTVAVLDSSYFEFNYGSFRLLPNCGYTSGDYDIGDLISLIAFMFNDGDIRTNAEADFNCDCGIDIADLIGFINYMFKNGSDPGCLTN